MHAAGFYTEHEIELRVDESVVDLDAGRQELALKSGERLGYDRLLLTTGCHAAPAEHPRRQSSTASTTCGRSPTATRCAPAWTPAAGSSSSAPAGSGPRSPPPPASAGST